MGLDQFLYITSRNQKKDIMIVNPRWIPSDDIVFNVTVKPDGKVVDCTEVSGRIPPNTWRKYHELQDYMEGIWMSRKAERYVAEGEKNVFNQEAVMLSEHDLDNLEAWLKSQDADFDKEGDINPDDDDVVPSKVYYRQANKYILKIARAFKAKGFEIEYNSWW